MLKKFVSLFGLAIFISGSVSAQVNTDPISLGIFPYVSTGKLVTHHAKLRHFLNRNLNRKLSFVTAKNMDFYFENVKNYQYDLIFTPPHLALFAKEKLGYQPIAMTTHRIRGAFLVAKNASYQTIKDIENVTISMVSEKALLHQMALAQLGNLGLVPRKNVTIDTVKTNNNAIYNLLMQDSQVAVTGQRILEYLPEGKKQKLRQIASTESAPGFAILSKPGLNALLAQELQQILLLFNAHPENQPYIFQRFKKYDERAVESMRIYARVFE